MHEGRAVPGAEAGPLRAWLVARTLLEPSVPALRLTQLAGGSSNLTVRVQAGEHDWVLRRPPLRGALPTAHDVLREYRLQATLRCADETLPLAVMVDACDDLAVIGAPFYLMHRLTGHAHTPDTLAALPAETVHAVGLALAEALAGLHRVDPATVPAMAEFMRAEPYADRQLRRWSGQWRRAQAATGLADEPALDDVFGALSASRPPVPSPRVVHGDYGFANVLYDPHVPTRVQAVLDWELATVGDPLADLGALSAYWSEAGRLLNDGRTDPVCHPSFQPALPNVSSLADRYAAASGTDAGLEHLGWYIALATARLAVIVAGALARIDPDNPAEADRRTHTMSLVHKLAVAAQGELPRRSRP